MLLTFIIDPPFLLFLGYLFACALPPFPDMRTVFKSRAFWAGMIVVTVFNVAVGLSYWWFPDWMWMYILRPSEWSPPARVIMLASGLLAYYLFFRLGFAGGAKVRGEGRKPWGYVIMCGVLSLVVIAPVFNQYYHVGTYREYVLNIAPTLPQSPLGLVYNITLPIMLVVGTLLYRWAGRGR